MAAHYNELPSWLAYPAAASAPTEGQVTVSKAMALVTAYAELASVMIVSDLVHRNGELDLDIEGAMRVAMPRPMGFVEWRSLFQVLLKTESARLVIGFDPAEPFPVGHPVALCHEGVTGKRGAVTLSDLLDALESRSVPPATAGPHIREAAMALAQRGGALTSYTLCFVRAVRDVSDEGFEVQYRPLLGTAYPETQSRRFWLQPPVSEGSLVFWNLSKGAVPVPAWLATYEEDKRLLRLYAGREVQSGRWLYACRLPYAESPMAVAQAPEGMPVFLNEPAWNAPPQRAERLRPAYRLPSDVDEGEERGTTTFRRNDPAVLAAIEGRILPARPVERAQRASDEPAVAETTDPLILRIVGGRNLYRYIDVKPGVSSVIGRTSQYAEFVIPDQKISRANTRVTANPDSTVSVQDLGSTNGTFVNGQRLERDPVPLRLGDLLGVGHALMRLERVSAARKTRIDKVLDLGQDHQRDGLTGLQQPARMATELGLTGDRFGANRFVGLLVHIDPLSKILSRNGQNIAEIVFQNVARVIEMEIPDPSLGYRTGYGEILGVIRGADLTSATQIAERIIQCVLQTTWEPVHLEVTSTASVALSLQGETIDQWLERARSALVRGRSTTGPNRVHPVGG